MPNGYQESIQKGLLAVRNFSRHMSYGKGTEKENIRRLADEIETADTILIGAGTFHLCRFYFTVASDLQRYFFDFIEKYISDTWPWRILTILDKEIYWAMVTRANIYYNRYIVSQNRFIPICCILLRIRTIL